MAESVARVRLALEGANVVEKGLAQVQSKVSDLGKTMVGLAGGLTAAGFAAGFAAWVKGAIDAADQTDELAQKTGLLTEQVAGLKLLFEKEGLGDEFGKTMAKLSKGASEGNKAFEAMGITVRNSTGHLKSTRELLAEVADKFAGYRDGAEKTALAMELFGKSGADLIPLLNNGAAGIDEMDQRARELGLTLSKETAAAAAQFNDNLFILKQYASSASVSVANELLPSLVDLSSAFVTATRYGGGLLGTLRLFGATTYGTDGFQLTKDIEAAREKVRELSKDIAGYDKTSGAFPGMQKTLQFEQQRLEYLKDLQRQTVKISPSDQSTAEARRLGLKTLSDYAPALAKNTQDTRTNAAAKRGLSEADKAAAEAAAELAKIMERARATTAKANEEAEALSARNADTVAEANQALREEIALIGLDETARAGLVRAKEADVIASKELELVNAQNNGATAATIDGLQREIALRRERLSLLDQRSVAEASAAQAEADKRAYEDTLKAQADAIRKQDEAYADMWRSVDQTAHDVFVNVADEGMDAFKRIGRTLKAAILDLLYQMTVKRWIIQISGQGSVGDMATNAAGQRVAGAVGNYASTAVANYAGGGNTAALIGGASGSMSLANASGSIAANGAVGAGGAAAGGTVAADGLGTFLAGNAAYGTAAGATAGGAAAGSAAAGSAAAGGTAAATSALSAIPVWGWIAIALIAFWKPLFGRKLKEVGAQLNFDGAGGITANEYKFYKGGVFRGNKTTVGADITDQSSQLIASARNVQAGAASMARAMGYSAEAVENYTGKLRINFKGANTAAEQSERLSKALEELQFKMLKAASGGQLARKEFERLMEQVSESIKAAGISTEGIAEIIKQGMLGKMSQAQVGEALGDMVIGGIYNTIVSPFAGQIAQAFMAQIITPMVTAVTTGGSISNAVSQASIQSVVATANAAAAQLSAILADPGFRAAIAGVQQAITGISAAAVRPAASVRKFGSAAAAAGKSASTAADEIKRAWSSIMDSLIDEVRRLRGEIVGSGDQALSYTVAQFASATAAARAGDQRAADQLPTLSRSVEEAALRDAGSRADLNAIRGYLIESQSQTASLINARYRLGIPSFDVGTNYVPRDMLAMIHEGEAVVPKEYNPAAGGNDAMLAQMRAMTAEAKRAADSNAAVALKLDEIAKGRWTLKTVAA